jgi:signal transduction histidine kinase
MSIRKKILVYFSFTVITLTGLSLFFIYSQFIDYREQAFRQRQVEKIESTLHLLVKIKQMDERIVQAMDDLTIHDFYDEKVLIFDEHKKLIYSSIDDLVIQDTGLLLDLISPDNRMVKTKENGYDLLGLYTTSRGQGYYGLSKAFDETGYSTLLYLRTVLIITFFVISAIVVFVSYYLSRRIAGPITHLIKRIHHYDFERDREPIGVRDERDEIAMLASRFNELMERMNKAFQIQRHVIHHISHELKTPIAVLVSNFEKMESESDPEILAHMIRIQKEDTHNLGEIINALLEITRAESAADVLMERVRIDELLFDISEELGLLCPDYVFSFDYDDAVTADEERMVITGNRRLLHSALMNLMLNAVMYSCDLQAAIRLTATDQRLSLSFQNRGDIISPDEQRFLFQHFFRGGNSKGKRGFGLGLVLIHKVISLHGGEVSYTAVGEHTNVFEVRLPRFASGTTTV